MVASYPIYPDLLAISNVLQEQQAEEQGEGGLDDHIGGEGLTSVFLNPIP
jgi:hypothetical protein